MFEENRPDNLFEDLDIFSLADRISRRYSEFFESVVLGELKESYGLTQEGLRVLQITKEENSQIGHRSLLVLSGMSNHQLKRTLVHLIGRKLVQTIFDPSESMASGIKLTELGEEACQRAAELMNDITSKHDKKSELTLSASERVNIISTLIKLDHRTIHLQDALNGRASTVEQSL